MGGDQAGGVAPVPGQMVAVILADFGGGGRVEGGDLVSWLLFNPNIDSELSRM